VITSTIGTCNLWSHVNCYTGLFWLICFVVFVIVLVPQVCFMWTSRKLSV
jgi:hypothetical protein